MNTEKTHNKTSSASISQTPISINHSYGLITSIMLTAIVLGNMTEEEVDLVNVVEPVREDPPQRDEVHTTPTKDQQRKVGKSISKVMSKRF